MSLPTFLTAADAAQILGVTPATVRQMAQRGKLRVAATTVGGIRLFDLKEVRRMEQERQKRQEARAAQQERRDR